MFSYNEFDHIFLPNYFEVISNSLNTKFIFFLLQEKRLNT